MRFDAVPIPVDGVEEFFATAPFVTRVRRTFDAPPEDVWRVVSGDRMWSWLAAGGGGWGGARRQMPGRRCVTKPGTALRLETGLFSWGKSTKFGREFS